MKCPICNADLSNAIRLLGSAAWDVHTYIHKKAALQEKNEVLQKGLEFIRDGGFGCAAEAQKTIDAANKH